MQSYDFLYLHDHYGCKLQMGGNDQWSNIIGGVELIRKIGSDELMDLHLSFLLLKKERKWEKQKKVLYG